LENNENTRGADLQKYNLSKYFQTRADIKLGGNGANQGHASSRRTRASALSLPGGLARSGRGTQLLASRKLTE